MTRNTLPGAILPALTVIGAVVLDLLPLPTAAPSFLIATFYFWTVHRPDLLPPISLFALGCLTDAIGGMPVGTTPLAILLARALILSGQRWLHRQAWPIVWASFLPVAIAIACLRWGSASLARGGVLPMPPAMLEAFATFLAYPVVASLLGLARSRTMAPARAAAGS
jgi:rod shape-determining protein MreD